MRRVTIEFNYRDAWKQIFGSNSEKVEVLEALRCFKCDLEGLAIICRIKMKDKSMNMKIWSVEAFLQTLGFCTKDGSFVVFIEGRSCIPQQSKGARLPNC